MSATKTLDEFYPTPHELISKMLDGVTLDINMSILEPSAGKGNIVNIVNKRLRTRTRYRYETGVDIDTIELNAELVHILRGSGYRVVHDDFLTYNTQKRYDLIIMNPPFSEGDKHLLHAFKFIKDGGMIACILNAETLKNQNSQIRKSLARRLVELSAEIEYIQNAFTFAERKTNVEIALIKVEVPSIYSSVILDGLEQAKKSYGEYGQSHDVVSGDNIKAIAEMYRFDADAITQLINEFHYITERVPGRNIIKLVNDDKDYYRDVDRFTQINLTLKELRYNYWEKFFASDAISKMLTQNLRQKFYDKLNELKDYDVTERNMHEMKTQMMQNLTMGVEDCIVALFDELSSRHSYNEYSRNIHYFDGWKTNKAWYINKKVILPLSVFSEWRVSYSYQPTMAEDKLADIEKVFNYLDVGRTANGDSSIHDTLLQAKEKKETQKIRFKFFTVTFYKKGTTHIEFLDEELLKKFNIFGSQQKKWLPPSYGKVKFEDMSKDEQEVINSFEGKDNYKKVCDNPSFYIYSASSILMLESGV